MRGLQNIKRRLDKIEASRAQPDQKVYEFVAWEHDPCLEVEAPWGGLNIIRVIVAPDRQPVPREDRDKSPFMQSYEDALKEWENGTAPLTAEEWLGRRPWRRQGLGGSRAQGRGP
jgi:hypothetical protein